jgi:uncharacterized protein
MSDQHAPLPPTHHPYARPYASDEPGAAAPLFPRPVLPEEEAVLVPQGPIPSSLDYTPRRIPHLGHAFIFLCVTGAVLLLVQLIFFGIIHPVRNAAGLSSIPPKSLISSEAIAYIVTLVSSWGFFPLLWHRSFADGIQWNFETARRNAYRLIPLGLIVGFSVQAISSLIPVPKSIPMDDFFRTRSDVWLVTAFGTLLAPLFEEVCFRGFLLPAFAIAYDWLSLPRLPIAHERWRQTTNITTAAMVFSGILTSMFFALIHAQQLAHAWVAVFVLFCVSLVLTAIRVRAKSVAASALVHACYNLSVFVSIFIATGGFRHLERMAR